MQQTRWFAGHGSRAVLVLAALVVGQPSIAGAQVRVSDKSNHWVWRHIHDDQRLEIQLRGQLELTDDERAVARLSPDGRLQIDQAGPGMPERTLIVTPSGGGVNHAYIVNGRAQTWDAEGQQWLAQLLPRLAREAGVGAEQRVRRIHRTSGVAGVLQEIEQIDSGSSRRAHLRALLELGPVPAAEMPRTLRLVGGISSSSTRGMLLRELLPHMDLGNAGQRSAFFQAAGDISSSSERRQVLTTVIGSPRANAEAVLLEILGIARNIPSSSERATVLLALAEAHSLSSERVRDAFFGVVNGIPSSSERRRVLLGVLQRHGESASVTRSTIRAAGAIPSDSEKATVLTAVPVRQLQDEQTARVYRDSMQAISSSSQRERVLRHLVGAQG